MDITDVAARAVAIVGSYLADVAAGVVDRAQRSAPQALTALIADRLGRTQAGAALLQQLQLQPADAGVREQVNAAVAGMAAEDPGFAAELERAVGAVAAPDNTIDRAMAQGQVTFHTSGGSMERTVIAGRDVDQSRRLKIGGGLVAVLLLGATGGAAGTYFVLDGNEPAPPAPTQSIRPDAADSDVTDIGIGDDSTDVVENPATVDEMPNSSDSVPVDGYLVAEPDTGVPGSTVVLTGTDFFAGERVRIYWKSTAEYNALRDTTADENGAVSVEVTVPTDADVNEIYHVYALGLTSNHIINTLYHVTE